MDPDFHVMVLDEPQSARSVGTQQGCTIDPFFFFYKQGASVLSDQIWETDKAGRALGLKSQATRGAAGPDTGRLFSFPGI